MPGIMCLTHALYHCIFSMMDFEGFQVKGRAPAGVILERSESSTVFGG